MESNTRDRTAITKFKNFPPSKLSRTVLSVRNLNDAQFPRLTFPISFTRSRIPDSSSWNLMCVCVCVCVQPQSVPWLSRRAYMLLRTFVLTILFFFLELDRSSLPYSPCSCRGYTSKPGSSPLNLPFVVTSHYQKPILGENLRCSDLTSRRKHS